MAEDKTKRIRELIGTLRAAGRAYYQESREIMSNFEYDKLYDELVSLEKETGIVFANSPTQNVGYEVVSALPKERHEKPMLSLNKTKSVEELADWLGGQTGLLSWKMDGLTIVLTYQNGTLVKAVTRGNGEIGEVITANAKAFVNVPLNISYQVSLSCAARRSSGIRILRRSMSRSRMSMRNIRIRETYAAVRCVS